MIPENIQKFFNPKKTKKYEIKEFKHTRNLNVGDVINYKMVELGYDYNYVIMKKCNNNEIFVSQIDDKFNIIIGGYSMYIYNHGTRKNPNFLWRTRQFTNIDSIAMLYN